MRTFRILLLLVMFSAGTAWAGTPDKGEGGIVDCRINEGPCTKTKGTISTQFDIVPKPIVPMREKTFSVTLREEGKPVSDASVVIGLTMPGMYMGSNKIRLVHLQNGIYEGKGVIIRCPSGKKVWKAAVSIQRQGKTRTLDFIFEVQ